MQFKDLPGYIQNILQLNYRRIRSFQKAACLTDDTELRTCFAKRAIESERNIHELAEALGIDFPEISAACESNEELSRAELPDSKDSSIRKILDAILFIEKSVIAWYNKVINFAQEKFREVYFILRKQYQSIRKVQKLLEGLAV